MDALSRLHLREAKGRFLALTGYPNDVEDAVVGELDAGFMAGVAGTDLILVRYRGGVMLARNLTGKEYAPGDIVPVKWMSSGRDPSLLKIIDRLETVTGDLYALCQWFADATGVIPQYGYYSVDTTTGLLTSIGLPTPTWRDASSGLVRDGVLWVVGSLSVGQNAAVASYTAATGWTVTDLGVKEQGIGGMVLDASGILYFCTALNLYGASVQVTMWEVSPEGFVNPMGATTITESGTRVHGIGLYTAGLAEFPNRLVFFYSYVDGTDTLFGSYDPNNDLERGPEYTLEGSGIWPSAVTYLSGTKGGVTAHTAEWRGNVDLLTDNYPADPVAAGWSQNVSATGDDWGAPHAVALSGVGAIQGVATLKTEVISDPEAEGGTNPHDALSFFGSGAIDEDFGSQIDTLFFVGSSAGVGGQTAILTVQQDVIADTAVRRRGGPRAGRRSGDKFYIPVGSPDGARYTNTAIDAGILSFDGSSLARLTTGTPTGDAGSVIRLYSEHEGLGDKPIPLPVMYTFDQGNVIMLRESGDYELLGAFPSGVGGIQALIAGTGYIVALTFSPTSPVFRYTRAAGWVNMGTIPAPTSNAPFYQLVESGNKIFVAYSNSTQSAVELYEIPESGAAAFHSSFATSTDLAVVDSRSIGPSADYVFFDLISTSDFTTRDQVAFDGISAASIATVDGSRSGLVRGDKGMYAIDNAGELDLLSDDGSSILDHISCYQPSFTAATGYVYRDFAHYGESGGTIGFDWPAGIYTYGAAAGADYGSSFIRSTDGAAQERLISVRSTVAGVGLCTADAIVVCNGSLYFTLRDSPAAPGDTASMPKGVFRWNEDDTFTQIYAAVTSTLPRVLYTGGPI